MTARFTESFHNADLALRYSSSGTVAREASNGKGGFPNVNLTDAAQIWVLNAFSIAKADIVHAVFYMNMGNADNTDDFFQLGGNYSDPTDPGHAGEYRITASGGAPTGWNVGNEGFPFATLASSTTSPYSEGTDVHIEIKAKYTTASDGYIKMWANGTLVIDFAGVTQGATAQNTTFEDVGFGGYNRSASPFHLYMSHFYLWDEAGSGANQAGPIGAHYVEPLAPASDSSVASSPSTGLDNFAMIDEAGANDGDTTYVEFTSSGSADLYGPASLSDTPETVYAIAVCSIARKTDANAANFRNRLKSSATVGESADHALTTSYALYRDYFSVDPHTGAAWTAAGAAAALSGFSYASGTSAGVRVTQHWIEVVRSVATATPGGASQASQPLIPLIQN